MAIKHFFCGVVCLTFFPASWAGAQGAYEIQVYPSETTSPGTTFVELHSNLAPKDPPDAPGGIQPDAHAFHETLELTHGFTDWFETGFYVFTSARDGEGWAWVGDHIRPRVRVPPAWHWPVGVSLSAEVGYLRREFSESSWDMELRPIVDWRSGKFYVSLNPVFDRNLRLYDTGTTRFVFAPSAKISYDVTRQMTFGVEYYGSMGPVENFDGIHAQQHQLYPALDLN